MNWFHRNALKIAITTVIFSFLWVIFGPLLITQNIFSLANFSQSNYNTGVIGDTIGGITSPIIGLASAILLYLALIKQSESNDIAVHEANFRIIYSELDDLNKQCETYEYHSEYGDYKGRQAILSFVTSIGNINKSNMLTKDHIKQLIEFEIFLYKFGKILYLLDNLKTSSEYKELLSNETEHCFNLYFGMSFQNMNQLWTIDETTEITGIKTHINRIHIGFIKVKNDIRKHLV